MYLPGLVTIERYVSNSSNSNFANGTNLLYKNWPLTAFYFTIIILLKDDLFKTVVKPIVL